MKQYTLPITALAASLAANSASQVCEYTGEDEGSWSDVANWSCGGLPSQQTGVVIAQNHVVLETNVAANVADISMFAGGSMVLVVGEDLVSRLWIDNPNSQIGWNFVLRLSGAMPPGYDQYDSVLVFRNATANIEAAIASMHADLPVGWVAHFKASGTNLGVLFKLWILADCNRDGLVTPADFTAWVAAYNSGDVDRADQNLDGIITPADFTAWIFNYNEFIGG